MIIQLNLEFIGFYFYKTTPYWLFHFNHIKRQCFANFRRVAGY